MAEFRLVTRAGEDTLHRWPAHEECNLDDSDNDQPITWDEAMTLVTGGSLRPCHHCFPIEGDVAGDHGGA